MQPLRMWEGEESSDSKNKPQVCVKRGNGVGWEGGPLAQEKQVGLEDFKLMGVKMRPDV